jgi:hypothetical protein
MRGKFVALLLPLVIVAESVFGLIGEDPKQIEAHYGKPQKLFLPQGNFREVAYASHGFMILVGFVDGISKREGFARPNNTRLSDDAVKQILGLSAPVGISWQWLSPEEGDQRWTRSDQKAVAVFPAAGTFFFVQDPEFVQPE